MFGIFYGLFSLTMGIIGKTSNTIEDINLREKSKQKNDLTYYYRGELRLTDNGRRVYRTIDLSDNHDVLKDGETGKIYFDYTDNEFKKKKVNATINNKTVFYYSKRYSSILGKGNPLWKRCGILPHYVDIKTNHPICAISVFQRGTFYMDLNDGKILRIADGDTCDNCDKIIDIINKRQMEMMRNEKYGIDTMWTREEFFLYHHVLKIDEKNETVSYEY